MVLYIPAVAVDLVVGARHPAPGVVGDVLKALLIGGLFVGSFWAVHWNYASVFVQEGGAGRFLAARWWLGHAAPGDGAFEYWTLEPGRRRIAMGMAGAFLGASLTTWVGLRVGQAYVAVQKTAGSMEHVD